MSVSSACLVKTVIVCPILERVVSINSLVFSVGAQKEVVFILHFNPFKMSWSTFWKFLERLRLIPVPDSRWGNRISCGLWLLIIIGFHSALLVLFYKDFEIKEANASKLIAYILIDGMFPIQNVSGILLIAYIVEKQRHLVATTFNIGPMHPWFFILMTAVQIAASILNILSTTLLQMKPAEIIFVTSVMLLNVIVMLTLVFVLSVLARSLSTMVKNDDKLETLNDFEETCEKIIDTYCGFKQNVQPILFMILISDVILVTVNSYLVIASGIFQNVAYLASFMLQLSYVTIVLDDCYTEFKSTIPRLRYNNKITTFFISCTFYLFCLFCSENFY